MPGWTSRNRFLFGVYIVALVVALPRAQEDPDRQSKADPADGRTVITATRTPTNPLDVARAFEVLDQRELRELRQVRTLPEALRESPGVSVQKTGPAQGSPKIRGMTGFYTLLLVDGIRVNTSIWRSGNVEYWNTVDSLALERLELVRGPSSVLYGSDAIAGTGQAILQGPGELEPGFRNEVGALFRYSSAEQSFTERLETHGNSDNFGWHLGATYRDYGSLVGGKTIGEMPQTAYRDFDADGKLVYACDCGDLYTFGFQHANPMDGPRTHSTVFAKSWRGTTPGKDFLRDIDQQRDLYWLRYGHGQRENGRGDPLAASLTVSWQEFREEENRVRSNSRRRIQGVDDNQLGVLGQVTTGAFGVEWTAGFDFYHERVDSRFAEFNSNGSLRSRRPRGAVADNARYDQLGLYLLAELALDNDRAWRVTAGVRYGYTEADADTVDPDPSDAQVFAPVHRAWNSLVGSAQLLFAPRPDLRLFGSVAQGFRAPNLSDLTRFDVALSGDLEIPSTGLDPERFVTFELGARFDDGLRRAAVTGFTTLGRDLIQRQPTGRIVGGNVEVTKANVSDGYWSGVEVEAATRLDFVELFGQSLDAWEIYAYGDVVQAVIDAADPADGRRTHPKGLPPAKGQIGLRWQDLVDDRLTFEIYVPFADGISARDYNAAERRNTQRIPPDGLPGYALVGVRGSARLNERLTASLAIENIANRDYRIFDSGLNEPGTNVIFTLRARF